MELFTQEVLSGIVNQSVKVCDDGDNTVELIVTEVTASPLDGDVWEAFSVIFKGDETFHLPQGNYMFEHPVFGQKKLFTCPRSAVDYQVMVSRQKQEASK